MAVHGGHLVVLNQCGVGVTKCLPDTKEETPNTIIAPVALLSPPSPLVTKHRIPLDVDWNTLHVHIAQNTATTKQIRHAKLMHRCLQALNQGMENRMRLLEHSCEEKPMHTTDVNLTERRRDTKSQEQEERSATWRHPWGPHLSIAEAVAANAARSQRILCNPETPPVCSRPRHLMASRGLRRLEVGRWRVVNGDSAGTSNSVHECCSGRKTEQQQQTLCDQATNVAVNRVSHF